MLLNPLERAGQVDGLDGDIVEGILLNDLESLRQHELLHIDTLREGIGRHIGESGGQLHLGERLTSGEHADVHLCDAVGREAGQSCHVEAALITQCGDVLRDIELRDLLTVVERMEGQQCGFVGLGQEHCLECLAEEGDAMEGIGLGFACSHGGVHLDGSAGAVEFKVGIVAAHGLAHVQVHHIGVVALVVVGHEVEILEEVSVRSITTVVTLVVLSAVLAFHHPVGDVAGPLVGTAPFGGELERLVQGARHVGVAHDGGILQIGGGGSLQIGESDEVFRRHVLGEGGGQCE